MNVLYISHEDDKYGAARSLQSLFTNMSNYKITPFVLTMKENGYNKTAREYNIKSFVVKYYRSTTSKSTKEVKRMVKYLRYKAGNYFACKKILSIIDANKIDIVHINSSVIDVGIYLKKHRNIKIIWHIREFMDLDFNQVYYNKNQIADMNRYADAFIFISKAIKEHWINKGLSDKGKVIYNGLDIKKYESIKEWDTTKNKINIVFTGSITPNKGQYQLIDALGLLPPDVIDNIKVSFLGSGSQEYIAQLSTLVKDMHLQNIVKFEGFVTNVAQRLKEYDIGIVASLAEGFGRVTVEYMLSGVLVIASDTGANLEILHDKETGLIFKYGDAKDLSEKLTWIIDHKEEISRIAKNARDFASSNFTEEKYVSSVADLYRNMINGKKV